MREEALEILKNLSYLQLNMVIDAFEKKLPYLLNEDLKVCQFVIDEAKKLLPIKQKEITEEFEDISNLD